MRKCHRLTNWQPFNFAKALSISNFVAKCVFFFGLSWMYFSATSKLDKCASNEVCFAVSNEVCFGNGNKHRNRDPHHRCYIIQLLKKTFAKDFQEYPEWSEISLWWCRLVIIVEFPSVIANKVFDLSVPPMFWLTFLMKSQRIHQFGETQILAVDILKLSGVV